MLKNDTNKSIEEKKRNYDEITKQQNKLELKTSLYKQRKKSIRELKMKFLNDIKEILENQKNDWI